MFAHVFPSDGRPEWQIARDRALLINHPLYPELLAAHAACLRAGTPVDQLPHIEAQLAQAQLVAQEYSVLHPDQLHVTDEDKFQLHHFMTQYTKHLTAFKDCLQQHGIDDMTEAIVVRRDLAQALHTLTGVSWGEGTGATMSDEEVDDDSDCGAYEAGMDPHDSGGFGPLVPTESERTLMERVRQELKYELKQDYRARIDDIRKEILRKRAQKLAEGTTTVLKAWWESHSNWPYPQEHEKQRLMQETGLKLNQVNNWFTNRRKRNWPSNPRAATTDLQNKRQLVSQPLLGGEDLDISRHFNPRCYNGY